MSKQLSAKCTETRKIMVSDATSWHTLTIEESRALRGELEKAEEEAGRKSAYMTWIEERKGQSLPQAWNAAIDAAIHTVQTVNSIEALRALKEPVE